jgi:adenylate cyclase
VDFTALGDAVNVAARLQSHAADGQVVLSADLYDLVQGEHPGAVRSSIDVRGRDQPVDIAVLTP